MFRQGNISLLNSGFIPSHRKSRNMINAIADCYCCVPCTNLSSQLICKVEFKDGTITVLVVFLVVFLVLN